MIFILGVLFGVLIAILLLIGQAVLYKQGITIDTPLKKISKKKFHLINPKKEQRTKKIFENL